jgi:hypothetical protein
VIEEKQTVYKRWLHSGIIEDNVEYKWLSAIIKKETRKRKKPSWEKFVTQLEYNIYKPNTYKILKHLNQEIGKTGDIHCTLCKDLCFQYDKLWTNANCEQEHWRPCAYGDEIITLNELEQVIKNLKNRKVPGEDNINS